VVAGGKKVFAGVVPRTPAAIVNSLQERADPDAIATAALHVVW
jgi:hypothetical protein